MLSVQHEPEKSFSKIGVPNSGKENRTLFVTETRDYCVWRGLRNDVRLVVGSDLYRQSVRFGLAIEITHFVKPKFGGVWLGGNGCTCELAHLSKRSRLR